MSIVKTYSVFCDVRGPSCIGWIAEAGWHEVVAERDSLADAQSQVTGLHRLEAEGDHVRNGRIERSVIAWEVVEA